MLFKLLEKIDGWLYKPDTETGNRRLQTADFVLARVSLSIFLFPLSSLILFFLQVNLVLMYGRKL